MDLSSAPKDRIQLQRFGDDPRFSDVVIEPGGLAFFRGLVGTGSTFRL